MISATVPIGSAMAWTRRVLFTPFDAGKWFALGFSAFLAELYGVGSYGYRGGSAFNRGRSGSMAGGEGARAFLAEHALLVGVLVVAGLAVLILVQWLNSRGQFMFLDNLVRDRAEVQEPWHRLRALGNNLFVFQLSLGLVALAVFAVIGALGWAIAMPDVAAGRFGSHALTAVLLGVGLALPALLVFLVINLLLRDFVVPVMYLRDLGAGPAFGVVRREVLPGNVWPLVLFYLIKLMLGMASVVAILAAGCLTCCIGFLPYLSSVLRLPITVFFRSYALEVLAQVGPEFRLLPLPE